MRVDVGMIIQRAPIFMHMRQPAFDFMKQRTEFMREYHSDPRQYLDEFDEVTKLNEDVLAQNPYASRMNIDNYPTHKQFDPKTGEVIEEYCAGSKNWSLTDPTCMDPKSLHYAGEDRTYLIVKNRFTEEWEFPITKINMGTTFFRAKLNLFNTLTDNKWRIKMFGSAPELHTIREFTNIEK